VGEKHNWRIGHSRDRFSFAHLQEAGCGTSAAQCFT